jgi:hypothetical protein
LICSLHVSNGVISHFLLDTRSLIVLITFHFAEIDTFKLVVLSLVVEVLNEGDDWYCGDGVGSRFVACQGDFNDDQVLRNSLVLGITRLSTAITQRKDEKHTNIAGSAMNNLSETL